MRKQSSRAEDTVWSLVRNRQINGAKFRRQHTILTYIADFACVDAKLIVEIDGRSHDDPQQAAYDAARTQALSQAGWRILRIRDDEVLTDTASVTRKIANALAQ